MIRFNLKCNILYINSINSCEVIIIKVKKFNIMEVTMKVLGVVGSRRKNGNTAYLVKEALYAIESEEVQTDLIFLGCIGIYRISK